MMGKAAGPLRVAEQPVQGARLAQVGQVEVFRRRLGDLAGPALIASPIRLAALPVGAASAISSHVTPSRRSVRRDR